MAGIRVTGQGTGLPVMGWGLGQAGVVTGGGGEGTRISTS